MSRRSRKTRRGSLFSQNTVENPMSSVGNVFDVAMVFSVALLVAIVMSAGLTELLTDQDITIVKNPGQENMQIIQKTEEGIEIMEINAEEQIGGGIGDVLGTAYRLEDGRVIYVPEGNETIGDSNAAASNETLS
ncbi:DUF2149 domain-containing protein [Methanimicrococcus blatticola]|uniref:DUF2149 domain-containing protein n=1 Tax=Methanimicrococcus blatticola TaxID=91560 RepID=A0A484F7X7_9EURY|nr:DUF2149 domain-containing protein [Methanimicrococcus blatticola]MBZ3935083.1 DUF2149 domain-containing protein [Methanimicrococcus blatticola]MCC2508820.1 DUF2149 domain-containing protein [Methanimicrococcus blatticola]TDQ71151.1 hypothetical protein C7391_0253 [Methanimicrococcus blatticola]